MSDPFVAKDPVSTRTLVLFFVFIPIVAWLIWYSMGRHKQFELRALQCKYDCEEEGYLRSEFKWAAMTTAECTCQDKAEDDQLGM